jgi:inner membrane protein
MTSSSHLASSALCYLAASALSESPISIQGLAVTVIGSLLPDIDTPTSSVGRPLFPLARWINEKIGHRTLTHSFVGLGIFTLLAFSIAWLLARWPLSRLGAPIAGQTSASRPETYAWLLVLGFASHIFVDTLNKTGVELFWPSKLRCVFFYNDKYRITAASIGDYWFMTACLVLNLAMYPLARDGLTRSLHQAFGDIYSVSMDFKKYGDKNRIWLDLQGVELISNQKVKGQFEILAVMDNGSVLIERNRAKQIVSRTRPLQIFPESTKIRIGESQVISIQHVNMAGRTLGELPRFPEASRVLFYGYLTPAKAARLSIHEDRYNSISERLGKLKLDHADYADVQAQNLKQLAIREGTLLVKIHHPAGNTQPPANVAPTEGTIYEVQLRFKPTDQILFNEGDVIAYGQVIAREDVSIHAAKLGLDYRQDLDHLNRQLTEVEMRLSEARTNRKEAEEEKEKIQNELAELESQALFAKEHRRLQHSLAISTNRFEEASQKITTLEQKRRESKEQIAARSERHAESVVLLERQGEIRSSFNGRVVRIEREPANQAIVYSVFYRP